jgi:hypothetical protein
MFKSSEGLEQVAACDFVVAVLDGAPIHRIDELLSFLTPLARERSNARLMLNANPTARLIGLARAMMEFGYGANPALAAAIGTCLLECWENKTACLPWVGDQQLITLLTVIRSTAHAHLLSGRFQSCADVIDNWLDEDRFGRFGEHYAGTYLLKAWAQGRQCRIEEALKNVERLARYDLSAVPDSSVVQGLINSYVTESFTPAPVLSLGERIQRIVEGPLAENQRTVSQWAEQYRQLRLPEATHTWLDERLSALQLRLEDLERTNADKALTVNERYASIIQQLQDFNIAATDILYAGAKPTSLNLHGVNRCIGYAADLSCAERLSEHEIEPAIAALAAAETWCRSSQDLHGLMQILQARRLLLAKAGLLGEAFENGLQLFAELRSLRARATQSQVRAAISQQFPRAMYEISRMAAECQQADTAIAVTEFLRGLALTEPAAGHAAGELPVKSFTQDWLGPRAHYVGFSCFDEDAEIGVTLVLSSGKTSFHWIPISPKRIRSLNDRRRVNPRHWLKAAPLCGSHPVDIRGELSILLDPIREAIKSGQITEGDHVCISADDPIHSLALQYLMMDGRPAVCSVSFSRVTSLHDAQQIYSSEVLRPPGATLVFIPAEDEQAADVARKRDACAALGRLLAQGSGATPAEWIGQAADPDMLRVGMSGSGLIHILAHGKFNASDPMRGSGLLVSTNGKLPHRGDRRSSILSPQFVRTMPRLSAGAHVSLCACVSGWARRGQGGDSLGLELALRMSGAASVIGAQWDVSWESAHRFFERFYGYWLITGMTRAQAWRHAILDLGKAHEIDLLEACAFTLFGDWR